MLRSAKGSTFPPAREVAAGKHTQFTSQSAGPLPALLSGPTGQEPITG